MFEERPDIQERLDGELVAWMTTVSPSGQPQTSPIWFLVEDETFVIYSLAATPRTRNIEAGARAPHGLPEGVQTRSFPIYVKTWNEENQTVEAVLATENAVRVWDWDRYKVVNEVALMT